MNKVIVRLENFSKTFGSKEVIDNLDLEVYDGEFLTLLGSSGCGKTTILRSISGLDKPTSGKVYIDGKDVTELDPPKREVNTIFQNYALFPLMNVHDNVAFGLKMKKVPNDEIEKRVRDMLKLVHLEGYENRMPSDLSGGEQQRVSIIRGLINHPKVLLLDEPLSALDLKLRKSMQIELRRLQRKAKTTFIYVTHDQDEALSMSDRIVVLNKGKIEQIGTPVEVYEKPNSLFVADFLGDSTVFEGTMLSKNKVKLDTGDIINVLDMDYKKGDDVHLIIRPENVKISKNKKDSFIAAKIYEQIYDGAFTKVLLEYKENKRVKAIISGNDKLFKEGDNVYLYWDIEDAIVLKKKK